MRAGPSPVTRPPACVTILRLDGLPLVRPSAPPRSHGGGALHGVETVALGTITTVIDHLAVQCADVPASAAFYDAALGALGAGRAMEFGEAIGYGVAGRPWFWLGPLVDRVPNREVHIAFQAQDRPTVRAFFDAAVRAGAEVLHEPREWPEYHPGYYAAFVRDPDGNNVEAVCHTPA